jgi:hypothetical protein
LRASANARARGASDVVFMIRLLSCFQEHRDSWT